MIDSLQLTAKHKVATPVNWQQGDNVIIAGLRLQRRGEGDLSGRLGGAEAVHRDRCLSLAGHCFVGHSLVGSAGGGADDRARRTVARSRRTTPAIRAAFRFSSTTRHALVRRQAFRAARHGWRGTPGGSACSRATAPGTATRRGTRNAPSADVVRDAWRRLPGSPLEIGRIRPPLGALGWRPARPTRNGRRAPGRVVRLRRCGVDRAAGSPEFDLTEGMGEGNIVKFGLAQQARSATPGAGARRCGLQSELDVPRFVEAARPLSSDLDAAALDSGVGAFLL